MILSSVYHTFSCRSEEDYWCFLSFDLFGIALSLLAIYMSGVYYAFWCHKVNYTAFSVQMIENIFIMQFEFLLLFIFITIIFYHYDTIKLTTVNIDDYRSSSSSI